MLAMREVQSSRRLRCLWMCCWSVHSSRAREPLLTATLPRPRRFSCSPAPISQIPTTNLELSAPSVRSSNLEGTMKSDIRCRDNYYSSF